MVNSNGKLWSCLLFLSRAVLLRVHSSFLKLFLFYLFGTVAIVLHHFPSFLVRFTFGFFSPFFRLNKEEPRFSFQTKRCVGVPKSFLRACVCKIPKWEYGPHALCCKQTSQFQCDSSLSQLQKSDLKYSHSSHDLYPIESGLERQKCSYFKYKSRWTASFWVNGKTSSKYEILLLILLISNECR